MRPPSVALLAAAWFPPLRRALVTSIRAEERAVGARAGLLADEFAPSVDVDVRPGRCGGAPA